MNLFDSSLVSGLDEGLPTCRVPPPHLRWLGVNQLNLQPLARVTVAAKAPDPASFALVNARSLVNKTFILKDIFESRGLDFLFVTETSMPVGELSAFCELLLSDSVL